MKLDDIKTRIEKIEKEKKQLATRQQQLQAIMNKKKKNEETRRKIFLGALILKEFEKNKGLQTYVVGLLKNLIERDRELFSDLIQSKESEDKASS